MFALKYTTLAAEWNVSFLSVSLPCMCFKEEARETIQSSYAFALLATLIFGGMGEKNL